MHSKISETKIDLFDLLFVIKSNNFPFRDLIASMTSNSASSAFSGVTVKAFFTVTLFHLENSCSLTKSTTFFVFPD